MTNQLMTIREMCDLFDVTPRTLRFYEAKELLSPIRQGQKRLFTHTDRARLKLILRGKRFGFSLEEIRMLLDLYKQDENNLPQLAKTAELARDHLKAMIQQRDDIDRAIADLKTEMGVVETLLGAVSPDALKSLVRAA